MLRLLAPAVLAPVLTGCGAPPMGKSDRPPPGHAVVLDDGVHAVTLTADAMARIRLATAPLAMAATTTDDLVTTGVVTARPGGRADVRAPLAGTVLAGPAALVPGTEVTSGQRLARLLPIVSPQRFVGIEAQAAEEAAQARVDAASKNATRVAGLFAEGSASARTVEQANADLAAANAELGAARQRVKRLGQRPLDADVVLPLRSPLAGSLLSVAVTAGQLVDAGTPLFTVADLDHLQVVAAVFVGDVTRLASDAPARVRLPGGDTWAAAARVSQPPVGLGTNPNVQVVFALDQGTRLPLGARVDVAIPRATAAAVAVPDSALFYDPRGRPQVYVVREPGVFVRTPVELGPPLDEAHHRLRQGPPVDTRVVTVGVPELIGTETGVGH